MSGSVSPVLDSTHSPPMNSFHVFVVVAILIPLRTRPIRDDPPGRHKYARRPPNGATRRSGRPRRRGCTEGTTRAAGRGAAGGGSPAGSGLGIGEQLAGPQGEPELHPVERRGEVPPGELLHLAHPVAERVPVDEQLGGGGLPAGVVLQERAEGRLQLAPV